MEKIDIEARMTEFESYFGVKDGTLNLAKQPEVNKAVMSSVRDYYENGGYDLTLKIKDQMKVATPVQLDDNITIGLDHQETTYGDGIYLANLPAGITLETIQALKRYDGIYQTAAALTMIEKRNEKTKLFGGKNVHSASSTFGFATPTALIYGEVNDAYICDSEAMKKSFYVDAGAETYRCSIDIDTEFDPDFSQIKEFEKLSSTSTATLYASAAQVFVRDFEVNRFVKSVITEDTMRAALSNLCGELLPSA